mmetsp:Transcript_8893/g.28227  ORF Transcript_8893/g.28227 Transcript_8893/m.28227 type:complete len:239 (+) Transcript_8893:1041-1757(+)
MARPLLIFAAAVAAVANGLVSPQPRARVASRVQSASGLRERLKENELIGIRAGLGVAYGLGGLVVRARSSHAASAAAAVACVWSGFVLAISFMEAVVKFRAEYLPKAFGLDVGRAVFPALNAVEAALCGTLWLLVGPSSPLLAASALLASQLFFLTPRLRRHGERAVHRALESHPYLVKVVLTDAQRDRYCRRRPLDPAPASPDPAVLHAAYVAAELAKLLCLATLATRAGPAAAAVV